MLSAPLPITHSNACSEVSSTAVEIERAIGYFLGDQTETGSKARREGYRRRAGAHHSRVDLVKRRLGSRSRWSTCGAPLQEVLKEEVTEFLGRRKSARRAAADPQQDHRNGYGKRRRLTLRGGTITVRRPRLWGLTARSETRILSLFARRMLATRAPMPAQHLHGRVAGDFDLAVRGC